MGQAVKSLKGIVIPFNWDDDGNIVQTAFMTFDEDMFLIVGNRLGRLSTHYLRSTVAIDGEILCKGPDKHIRITRLVFEKDG